MLWGLLELASRSFREASSLKHEQAIDRVECANGGVPLLRLLEQLPVVRLLLLLLLALVGIVLHLGKVGVDHRRIRRGKLLLLLRIRLPLGTARSGPIVPSKWRILNGIIYGCLLTSILFEYLCRAQASRLCGNDPPPPAEQESTRDGTFSSERAW